MTLAQHSNRLSIGLYAGKGANTRWLAPAIEAHGFHCVICPKLELSAPDAGGFDVLCLPGGDYRFDHAVKQAIVRFVNDGGGCVGVCAGAYQLAGYIPVIPGRVLRSNMRGRLYLEPQQGEHPILRGAVRPCVRHDQRRWEPVAITHLGGPMMFPDDAATIVASYDFEGQVGALVAACIGRGRAVACASHPEHPLAPLCATDPAPHDVSALQGDPSLIFRNALLWSARRDVPMAAVAAGAGRHA